MATITVTRSNNHERAQLRRRAMAKAVGCDGKAGDPLDEDEQEDVLEQFKIDIDSQFRLLRRVMVILCILWEILMVAAVIKFDFICKVASTIISLTQNRSSQCPVESQTIVCVVIGTLAAVNLFTFAFLLMGDKNLLRFGFYVFLGPLLYLGYVHQITVTDKGKSQLLDGDLHFLPNNDQMDLNMILGLLAALVGLSALFHYLSGNVYSSREDLRDRLQLLAAKRYSFKSI